jgi:hypothetical protein
MRTHILAISIALAAASALSAQDSRGTRTPISIGNYPDVDGLRLNFRDSDLGHVNGVNITLWTPYEPPSGTVRGLALGLPLTGAGDIDGIATGVLGVGAGGRIRGITLAPIGAGSGGGISGVGFGGVGLGSGGDLTGLMVGGVGAGAGGNMKGIIIGGVGAGAGGGIKGLTIAGVGAGAGGTVTGITLAGVGVGSGEAVRGFALAGVGIGAPRLAGVFAALAVGGQHVHGMVIAPAMFRVERGGNFTGGSVSTVNYIRGSQNGVAIGVVNYARSVNGVQIGIVNIIADSHGHPFLPLLNWGSGRD